MIISQTPLRISFCGGGTDLPSYCCSAEGKVLSTAIDKYVYVIVQERFDDLLHVNYARRKEVVGHAREVRHDLVREALLAAGLARGLEVTTLADVPSDGSGLGSSSALTVGLLNAFYAYCGSQVDAETLARQACEIELARCRKPIGRQDQYIAAYGGVRFLTFAADGSVRAEPLRCTPAELRRLESSLLLYYTDKTRRADEILSEQARRARDNKRALDRIRDLAVLGRRALETGEVDRLGALLHENWLLKRGLGPKVSSRAIDALYSRARRAGALGGKLAGAGGGGFLILFAPGARRTKVQAALCDRRELPISLEPDGSKIIFNMRRRVWK